MDILYILGKGSKHDNIELRWAMRSVEKYMKNIDRVFIVGEDPGFLSDKVVYIPCEDIYKEKHKNMLYKIQYAVENSDISDVFLVSSDDIMLLKPADAITYPLYYCGDLPQFIDKSYEKSSYKYQLYNTRDFLVKHHMGTRKFALHCIHKMNRKFFNDHEDLIQQALQDELGVEPNCLVCNAMDKEYVIEYHQDHKIMNGEEEENNVSRIRADWTEFSVSDCILNDYTMGAIKSMYPNKCKWEK